MITSAQLTKIDTGLLTTSFIRKFGGYTLLEAKRENAHTSEHPFYWRLQGRKGLVEVGLDATGALLSIDVPSIVNLEINPLVHSIPEIRTEYGIPYFSIDLWKKDKDPYNIRQYLFDEQGDIKIEFDQNQLRLSLGTDPIAQIVEIPGKIRLELNPESKVVSFLFNDLSQIEVKGLIEYFSYLKDNGLLP